MATIKFEIDTEAPRGEVSVMRSLAATKTLLVSAVNLTVGMVTRFGNGVSDVGGNLSLTTKGGLGYAGGDTTPIEKFIKDNHGPHSLIVTVGGSITHVAANKSSAIHQKNWIALLGGKPDTSGLSDKFLGGVVMGSYESNVERFFLLQDKGVPAGQIYLYTNKNSAMHVDEVNHWKNIIGSNNIIEASGDNTDTFSTDFSGFAAAVRGLVISADPFFTSNKTALIKAANTWLVAAANRQICYPLQIYANTGAPTAEVPRSGQSTILGPDGLEAYYLLGQVAALAINQKSSKFLGYWPTKDHRTNF